MSDDPAHKILGGDWQLPTTKIWQALNTSSNWSWTIKSGKKGMEVENNSTHNSIFLPVAGRGSGTSFYLGDYGYYWSGTARSSTSAYYLFFRNGQISAADYYDRYYGLLVRPVRLVAVD